MRNHQTAIQSIPQKQQLNYKQTAPLTHMMANILADNAIQGHNLL